MSNGAAAGARPAPLLTPSFGTLLVAQASFGYAFSSFLLLPKYLEVELGAGPAVIGWVAAAYSVAVALSLPAFGAIVDRRGRRDFLTLGALLMAVTSLGFVAVDEVGPLLYGLRVAQGLAFSMAFVAGATMAVHAAPPERLGQAIGIFGLTFLAMNGVAPVVVEELSRRGDWSWGFALAAAAALLSAALSRRVADVPGRVDPSGETPSLAEVLARPYMLRALLVIALVGMALGSAFNFYQLFALERGIPEVRGFFVAYTAAAVFVRLGLGRVIDAAGRRQVSVASLVLYVVVILSMSEVRPAVFELLGAGLGAAHGLFYPAFNAIAVEGALRNARGKVMASFQAAFHVGSAGGAVLLGELAGRSGYPGVFAAAGLGTLLALVLLVALPEPEESR